MEKDFYYSESYNFTYLLKSLDILALLFSASVTYYFYFEKSIFHINDYQSLLFSSVFLLLVIFSKYGLYKSWRGRNAFMQLRVVFSAWATLYVSLITIGAMLKITAIYSRLWFGTWSILFLICLFFFRYFFTGILKVFRKKGWNKKNILIYGANELGANVANRLSNTDWIGLNVVGLVNLNGQIVSGVPENYEIFKEDELLSLVKEKSIHEVWISLPLKEEEQVKKIMHTLRLSTVDIRFVPDLFSFKMLLNQSITEIAGIATVNLNESPMSGNNLILKEIEDRVLGLIIFILFLPIMLIVALIIKLESKGPIVFKQQRHGYDGKAINVYKFRSMFIHGETKGKITQATKNDSRITKVGAFLRKTSLDELPQFYNVLQGRMSIVGPRPHAVEHNNYYMDLVDYYALRHKVKPGITGWAQINGWRGETDTLNKMKKRVEYDLYYIQNWSLIFDLKIIFLTIFKGFVSKNAY